MSVKTKTKLGLKTFPPVLDYRPGATPKDQEEKFIVDTATKFAEGDETYQAIMAQIKPLQDDVNRLSKEINVLYKKERELRDQINKAGFFKKPALIAALKATTIMKIGRIKNRAGQLKELEPLYKQRKLIMQEISDQVRAELSMPMVNGTGLNGNGLVIGANGELTTAETDEEKKKRLADEKAKKQAWTVGIIAVIIIVIAIIWWQSTKKTKKKK